MGIWATLTSIFAACAVVAWGIAALLRVEYSYVFLCVVILAYMALSSFVWFKRRGIRKALEALPEDEREVLGVSSPEYRFALKKSTGISGTAAGWIGCIAVNGPLIPFIVGPLGLAQYVFEVESDIVQGLVLALGFLLAWCWWSASVTVWRWWAARQGMESDEIQWRGENASFLWPEGHFFERTELGCLVGRLRRRNR